MYSQPAEVISGNPKTQAEALYDQNQNLLTRGVRAACGFTGLRSDQWEDAFSAARLGLWYAATHYDPGRGVAFPTFARWHIRGELSHYFRLLARLKKLRDRELDAPLIGGDGSTLLDTLTDDPAQRPGTQLLAETGFEALVGRLPPRSEECLRWLYQEQEPLTTLAETWGVSRAAVSAMHTRALQRLRQLFPVD